MIAARDILERRLLAALEQGAGVGLPPAFKSLRPEDANLRPAASLLLHIAAQGSRAEMAKELRAMAARVETNREGRKEGLAGELPKGEEKVLWPQLAEAVEGLGRQREEERGIFGLDLWSDVGAVPVDELWTSLRHFLPQDVSARETFLTGVARVLLRALARQWTDETRSKAQP